MKKNTIIDYLTYGSGQLINLIAPLLVAPKVITVCGIVNWGKLGVALSVFTLLGLFIDFGSNILGVKQISVHKDHFQKVQEYLNCTFAIKLIFFLIILFVITFISIVFNIKDQKLYLLALTMLSAQFFNVTWIYQGFAKFGIISRLIFFSKVIYVVLVYLLVQEKNDYIYVLLILGASNTLVYFYFFIKIHKLYNLSILSVKTSAIKNQFLNEYPILISNFSVTTYTQSPILIVQYLLGDYYAGIYKIGDMILSIFRSYLSVFFNVSFPKFCESYSKNKKEGLLFLKKINCVNICLLIFGVLILIIGSNYVLTNYINNEKIYKLLGFYSGFIIVPIITALNIPFYQYLIYKNEQKVLSKILSFGSVTMLILGYFLTLFFQLKGSLTAVFIIEGLITTLIIVFCVKKYRISFKNISIQ
ncbi:oligosaccharide flippase family protein [Flavobacterium sp. FlaQc-57]|uniref:oligosaccharide flippase family protein n=1 Tax=Flavobacterium sp. FlaQc-57 TaxID=3374186 RepID=UPI003756671F